MKNRYSSIVNRCNGKTTDYYGYYTGKDYMPIYEWVVFCNENKDTLLEMWNTYASKGKSSKYAVSIDRIDNEKGYIGNNIQFVTHGFNSWKRSLNPISVTHDGETQYFMTREEASIYYGLRRQTIGECLSGFKYCIKGYLVKSSTMETVLKSRCFTGLEEYYDMLLEDGDKKWDTRKRWSNNHR